MSSAKFLGLGVKNPFEKSSQSSSTIKNIYRHAEEYTRPRRSFQSRFCDYNAYNYSSNCIWESQRLKEGGNSLRRTFTLLSESIPHSLNPFLALAALAEPQLFEKHSTIASPADIVRADIVNPNETPLSRFCRYTNTTVVKTVEKMRRLNRSPDDFFSTLNNMKEGGIYLALEHLIHDKRFMRREMLSVMEQMVCKKRLGLYMLSAGAKKTRIRNVTGLSHSCIDHLVRDQEKGKQLMPCSEPSGFKTCMKDTVKCRFAITILSLYFVCMRVMLNQKARFHPLSLQGMPAEISYTLITGCYLCMRELYSFMNYEQWSASYYLEFFPNFNDICDLLISILEEKTRLVACVHCNTPYFLFDSVPDNSHKKDLNLEMSCPCCAAKSEYYID